MYKISQLPAGMCSGRAFFNSIRCLTLKLATPIDLDGSKIERIKRRAKKVKSLLLMREHFVQSHNNIIIIYST